MLIEAASRAGRRKGAVRMPNECADVIPGSFRLPHAGLDVSEPLLDRPDRKLNCLTRAAAIALNSVPRDRTPRRTILHHFAHGKTANSCISFSTLREHEPLGSRAANGQE